MRNILGGVFDGLLHNLLNWQLVQGYIRSALMAIGSWVGLDALVGKDGTNIIIGAVLVIFSVFWQTLDNNMKKKAMDVVKAVDAHPEITVVPAAETATNKPVVAVLK